MQKENNLTVGQWCDQWFTTNRHKWNGNTEGGYRNLIYSHILPGIGSIELTDLTEQVVTDFYNSLRSRGLSARSVWCVHLLLRRCMDEAAQSKISAFLDERKRFGSHRPESPDYPGLNEETMRHIHRLLQQCLDQAVRDGLMTDNPARAFHYSKPKKVSANVLTPLEIEDYLDAAERLGYLPMFLLALTVGLRQGELIALKWSDLDVKQQTLTIAEKRAVERRELVEYGGETRTIVLTPEVVALLVEEHAKHPSSPLMFMHPATQKPFSPQMVRRMHKEIIIEAGLDHIRFTDLRHPYVKLTTKNISLQKQKSQATVFNSLGGPA